MIRRRGSTELDACWLGGSSRGVRFVQLFHAGQPWDNHEGIQKNLPAICRKTDKPAAGLIADLKQRGLLDSTLVHWGGEIGRSPFMHQQQPRPTR